MSSSYTTIGKAFETSDSGSTSARFTSTTPAPIITTAAAAATSPSPTSPSTSPSPFSATSEDIDSVMSEHLDRYHTLYAITIATTIISRLTDYKEKKSSLNEKKE